MYRYSHLSCHFRCHSTTSKSHSRFAQHTRTSSFVKVKLLLIILWSPWEVRSHYLQTDSTPWMAYTTWPRTGPNESKDSDCRPVRNMYSKAKDISLAEPSSSSTPSYLWFIWQRRPHLLIWPYYALMVRGHITSRNLAKMPSLWDSLQCHVPLPGRLDDVTSL